MSTTRYPTIEEPMEFFVSGQEIYRIEPTYRGVYLAHLKSGADTHEMYLSKYSLGRLIEVLQEQQQRLQQEDA